jgi:NitT/TauT family transport system permease protein
VTQEAAPSYELAADEGVRLVDRMREGTLGLVLLPALTLAVAVGVWQWVSKSGLVNEIILPAPTDIASELVDLVQQSSFWHATWVTAQEAVIGFVAGVLVAWILGTLIAMFRIFSLAFYPLIIAFQISPRIALAPVFLTWFGFGMSSKIVMAATICFFPVLVNVVLGLEGASADSRALMRSFGASKWETYRKLLLPTSLPATFASLKVAIALAMIGAVVGEFVGASEGLGVLIRQLSFQLEIAASFAVLIVLSLLGLVFYGATSLLEAKVVYWRGRT